MSTALKKNLLLDRMPQLFVKHLVDLRMGIANERIDVFRRHALGEIAPYVPDGVSEPRRLEGIGIR